MLTLRKDLDRFHRLLRLRTFFAKDKIKKSELAEAHKAFMEYQHHKPDSPSAGQKSSTNISQYNTKTQSSSTHPSQLDTDLSMILSQTQGGSLLIRASNIETSHHRPPGNHQ